MLEQPVRVGGLALAYALATSALVLVTFLASNLVLSVIGGFGGMDPSGAAPPADRPSAVLLSAAQEQSEQVCDRLRERGRADASPRVGGADRCAGQRRSGDRVRP